MCIFDGPKQPKIYYISVKIKHPDIGVFADSMRI